MKNLSLLMMALLTASVLTACGGDKSNASTETVDSAELIINNGRGTSNGHETEVPK